RRAEPRRLSAHRPRDLLRPAAPGAAAARRHRALRNLRARPRVAAAPRAARAPAAHRAGDPGATLVTATMTARRRIDFNCDLGEGCGDDAAIVPWISSASIACGAHAGDDASMRATLRLCRAHGVAAGAHPGHADPDHFGRRELDLSESDLRDLLHAQPQRIAALADAEGVRLAHVKPHRALYNQSAREPGIARVIATSVRDFDPGLRLYGLAGSASIEAAKAAGLAVAEEAFAERAYDGDGRLAPRGTPGAVLAGIGPALAQV